MEKRRGFEKGGNEGLIEKGVEKENRKCSFWLLKANQNLGGSGSVYSVQ